jgi:hypothetical protein
MLSRLRDCAVGEMVHDATGVLSLSPKNSLPRRASRDWLLKAMALMLNVCNRLLLHAPLDQVRKDAVASRDHRKSYLQKAHLGW